MLSPLQLQALFQRKGLSRQAQRVIEQVRDSQPTRRVRGGRGNVTSLYPSKKMGVIIQAESHKVELPFAIQMEMDSRVHEYYDQPPAIKLLYRSKEGRQLGVMHTPDFFCLGEDWTGWVECKSEGDLVHLAEKSPYRYVRTEDGAWRCPPGEEYAAHVGLEYRVFSSAEIDWIFQANVEFLGSYLGKGMLNTDEAKSTRAVPIISIVTKRPGITLADLLEDSSSGYNEVNGKGRVGTPTRDGSASKGSAQKNADVIYSLIATGGLYVDLHAARLSEPYRVHVFRDQEAARAHSWRLETYIPSHTPARRISQLNLTAGAALVWDGQPYIIVNLGQTHTFLSMEGKRGEFVRLPNDIFAGLIEQGEVTSGEETDNDETLSPEALEIRQRASRHDEAIANERFAAIAPYLLPGDALPGQGQAHASTGGHTQRGKRLPLRTLARHKANFRKAESVYGCGYDGLLPRHWKKGNRDPKLPDISSKIMDELIENQYETYKQQTKSTVYSKYCLKCESEGVQPASYKTFLIRVRNRPIYEQELKRKGHRAAYASKPFHLELDYTTPKQGNYPFHVVYMDHTQADAELVCSDTGENLGRPYVSFATDGYTKKILAVYATYDPPSYRSCMMLVREMVRQHGRMPSIAIVDGGREFHSTYFDTLLARNLCMKKTRPPAEPRFGSSIERIFGTTNKQFFHSIKGNTQVMKYVRQVTKGVNPKGHAIWNLEAFYCTLREYCYEIYDVMQHPALGQSPREALEVGLAITGAREHAQVRYDDEFIKMTMPSGTKDTAKVQHNGVKINYRYYSCDAFRDPRVLGTQVPVRHDPYNAGIAHAYVSGRWVECYSEYYTTFRGHSEREIQLLTQALREKDRQHNRQTRINARRLAVFLQSVEGREVVLEQAKKDRELKTVLQLISGYGTGEHRNAGTDPDTEGAHKRLSQVSGNNGDYRDNSISNGIAGGAYRTVNGPGAQAITSRDAGRERKLKSETGQPNNQGDRSRSDFGSKRGSTKKHNYENGHSSSVKRQAVDKEGKNETEWLRDFEICEDL